MHAAAHMVPDFAMRRALSMDELAALESPAVIYEHFHVDTNGEHAYVYTIAGQLEGREVAHVYQGAAYGCTVAGDVIVIHAKTREDADAMAVAGLDDTIEMARSSAPDPNAGIAISSEVLSRS